MQEFPELSGLSRDDLEDLLNDHGYFQSIFHSLSPVKQLYQSQAELSTANEAIARSNLSLQDRLYQLRSETKDAFDEAKALEGRWRTLEREQKELYQVPVCSSNVQCLTSSNAAIHAPISLVASPPCNDRSGQCIGDIGVLLRSIIDDGERRVGCG